MKQIIAFVIGLALASGSAHAANYTYTEMTSTTTQWSAGTSWNSTPVSANDTRLIFTSSVALDSGVNVVSNNDNVGNFLLNRLDFTYTGNSTAPIPTVTISGNPLEFTGANPTFHFAPPGTTGNLGLTISNNLVLSNHTTVSTGTNSASPDRIVTLSGTISGTSNLTFNWGAGAKAIFVLSNSSNSYTGDTRLLHSSTTSRTYILRLGASNVIPNGAGYGNVFFQTGSEANGAILQLYGNNETINGLTSSLPPSNSNLTAMAVQNGLASSDATLTFGDNNADGTFFGGIQNGGATAVLHLVKIGSGTQVFASPGDHTGNTTVSNGTLKIDFNQRATTQTTNPANYFSSNSSLIIGGGATFAIQGREDGDAITNAPASIPGGSPLRTFVLNNSYADLLTVGQNLTMHNGSDTNTWIVGLDRGATTTRVSINVRTVAGLTSVSTANQTASTSQTIKSLTLAGGSDSTHYLDFGTSGNVTLTINAAPVQDNDGSKLKILNWAGTPLTGGGSDRLLFAGDPSDFTSVFSQDEVEFDGYAPGYVTIAGSGIYEVAAIPEPGTLGVVLGGIALLALRRRIQAANR